MLGSGASTGLAGISRSTLGMIVGVLLMVSSAPSEAQTVPPPPDSASCTQNFAARAFACGGLSSAVGANATAAGEQAAAGGTASNNLTNARTTAFGAGALAGTTGPGQVNSTAVGQNAQANGASASAFGQAAQANSMGATAVGRVARANALDASALGVGAQAGAFSTALGSNSQATGFNAVAIGAGAQAVDLSTALGTNAQALAPDAVALGQGSVANQPGTISVGDAGSGVFRRIVDVAPAAGGTDAVNLSQLLSFITGNSFHLPPPAASGAGSTAIAAGSVASGDYAVALGQASTASGNSSTALGRSAVANGDFSTAIGQGARALATNSVAIGSGTIADQPNTASVGGRRLVDLAPGIAANDAATVGQLRRNEGRLSGGIAAAAALGGAVLPDQGRTFVGFSGATYNGEGGFGFGLVHHLDRSNLVLSGGVALGTGGAQAIGRVGVGWLF